MKEHLVGLVVRHGDSSANAMGIFRSWLDVPLTKKGVQQAKNAAKFLEKYNLRHVICSPLLRTFVTADIIAAPHKLSIYQHRGLLPWRLGIFSGLGKDENEPALDLFVKNPDVVIPQGESLCDFEDRQFAFWDAALKMAKVAGLTLYVTHNSVITSLSNMTTEEDKADAVKEDAVKPGGVAEIWYDGKKHRLKPVFGEEEDAIFSGS